jgi:hypothetical protein
MDKFERAEITNTEEQIQQMIADVKMHFPDRVDEAEEMVRKTIDEERKDCLLFINDVYQVLVRKMPPTSIGNCDIIWLSIKRLDREVIHDWRDFQEIKNQLVGPQCEAIEIYPAESRMVDTSNQYHLWVFLDPEFRLPMGFQERLVSNVSVGGSKQRDFGKSINIRPSKRIRRRNRVLKKKK